MTMTNTKRNLPLAALGVAIAALGIFFLLRQPMLPEIRDLAITHVNLIDATGAPEQADETVLVSHGRIVEIGAASKVTVPAGATKIDGTGKYLIPGLWDMHVHFWDKRLIRLFPPLYLCNGVTGVRDMGNPPKEFSLLKKFAGDVERGKALGPHIFTAGEILDGPRPRLAIGIPLHNEAEARTKVDWLKREGAGFVKVYEKLPRDVYFAIIDEAKHRGLPVAGHVPNQIGVLEASNAGQKSIEHLSGVLLACSGSEDPLLRERRALKNSAGISFREARWQKAELRKRVLDSYDSKIAARLFTAFAKNGTWMVPTLVMHRARASLDDSQFRFDPRMKYMPSFIKRNWEQSSPAFVNKGWTEKEYEAKRQRLRRYLEMIRDMDAAGVKILAGTDAPVTYAFPGFSLHDELELLVQAGMTPMESLQSATKNAAAFLGISSSSGTIEKGKIADLVLLDANPLDDIRNTQRIKAVVFQGRLIPESELASMLSAAASMASKQ